MILWHLSYLWRQRCRSKPSITYFVSLQLANKIKWRERRFQRIYHLFQLTSTGQVTWDECYGVRTDTIWLIIWYVNLTRLVHWVQINCEWKYLRPPRSSTFCANDILIIVSPHTNSGHIVFYPHCHMFVQKFLGTPLYPAYEYNRVTSILSIIISF